MPSPETQGTSSACTTAHRKTGHTFKVEGGAGIFKPSTRHQIQNQIRLVVVMLKQQPPPWSQCLTGLSNEGTTTIQTINTTIQGKPRLVIAHNRVEHIHH